MNIVQGDNIAQDAVSQQPAPRSYKTVKGVLALAAAGALLAGGAGTLALWSDSETLDGRGIDSGHLRFASTTAGTWTDTSGPPAVIPDITTFRVVPGDKLTYSLSTVIEADGENLRATLAADPTSVTGSPELLRDMVVTTNVAIGGTATSAITELNDGQTVDVTVTFDFSAASPNDTQGKSLSLADLQLTLNQNPR